MPELPEVETVRRSLERLALGRTIAAVQLRRPDIVTGEATDRALLHGATLTGFDRHGKELLILSRCGRGPRPCLGVHLGMTGSLRVINGQGGDPIATNHVHVTWTLDNGAQMRFRDPRRFGGLWTFPDEAAMRQARLAHLGPDALQITPTQLHTALTRTKRAIKAALLDQAVVAGVGNIYADELLFACGIHPATPAYRLPRDLVATMVRRMKVILRRAVAAKGSTLRDYVDADGQKGAYQTRHTVYGRGGKGCQRCGQVLGVLTLAGRTTVFCATCQPRRRSERLTKSRDRNLTTS
ncbi:MAG: bifunctional DNA-formamidopyrimidine glycosylase/DNA-(apurinic or apyrimidinic site) lyase [Phycisphaeraceae bacterium]